MGHRRLHRAARRGGRQGPVSGSQLLWTLVAAAALVATAAASIAFGSRDVGLDDVLAGLGGRTEDLDAAVVPERLPRTVLAVVVGAALGLGGALLQGVTRNPLGDPALLGISSGAAFAVVVGITFFGIGGPFTTMGLATIGAAGAGAFVYAVGSLGRGGPTPLKLALSGAVTAAAFTSLVTAMVLTHPDVSHAVGLWQIGGVGGASWEQLAIAGPVLGAAGLLGLLLARPLNSLALGDDLAAGLGERVRRVRLLGSLAAVVLCGVATALAGPIAFVGLVVPHAVRLCFGSDHRWLLPISAVAGAVLLTAADVLGRVVARPAEIEVGIVTALLGAPIFIVIVRRMKARGI
ncbi:MAG: iron ABC transporter permease [Microbacteriaceae bacterium]|nr:iron ABC transporter permease [Microbacteriaceae bacterium]